MRRSELKIAVVLAALLLSAFAADASAAGGCVAASAHGVPVVAVKELPLPPSMKPLTPPPSSELPPAKVTLSGKVAELWNRTFRGLPHPYMTVDLNGDKVPEVVSDVMDGGDCILTILRGDDGSVEWQRVLAHVSNGWMYSEPAGDLNGDGLCDLVVFINDYTEKWARVVGVGCDIEGVFRILWQRDFTDAHVWGYAVPNVTLPKGTADVLVYIHKLSVKAGGVALLNGENGVPLWGFSSADDIWATPVGDLNVDGLNDFTLTIWNWTANGGAVYGVRGYDGGRLWSFNYEGCVGIFPTDDHCGHGCDDIVVNNRINESCSKVSVRCGIRGREIFRVMRCDPGSEVVFKGRPYDIDGDGKREILILSSEKHAGALKYWCSVEAFDDDLSWMWRKSLQASPTPLYPLLVEDVTGDGVPDVLLEFNNSIVTLNGVDGAEEWRLAIPADWWWLGGVGDFDGDGLDDLVLNGGADDSPLVIFVDGDGGVTAATLDLTGWDWAQATVIGDFDGDGADDVAVQRKNLSASSYECEGYSLLRGSLWVAASNTSLWLIPVLKPYHHVCGPHEYGMESNGEDLNGDGSAEVGLMEHRTLHVLTRGVPSPPPPSVLVRIWTDKLTYTTGDTMDVFVGVKNPGGAVTVRALITLETPVAVNLTLVDRTVTLPAGLSVAVRLFRFRLPSIPKGVYTWRFQLRNPVTDAVITEDTASWTFS